MNEEKVSIEIVLESEDYGLHDQRWLDVCRELYEEIQPELAKKKVEVKPKVVKSQDAKGLDVTLFNTLIAVITSPGVGYGIYKLLKLLIETHERIQRSKKFKLKVEGEAIEIDAEGISEKKIDSVMQRILERKEQERKMLGETEAEQPKALEGK